MIFLAHPLRHSLHRPLRHLFAIFFIAACAIPTGAKAQFASNSGAKSVVTTDQVRAELMAHAPQGVGLDSANGSGNTVWVGLQLAHQPGWHTYWKNAGDSGLPTVLQWTLPTGVTAGDIGWPLPTKIPIGTLANYGYEGTVLLPVPLTITSAFKPPLLSGDIEVKLKAAWLVCKKECIPQEGEFAIRIPVKGSTALNAGLFQTAFDAQPRPLAASPANSADSRVTLDGQSIKLTVAGLPAALQGKVLAIFPETPEVIETAAQAAQSWQGAVWSATLPLSAQRLNSPQLMPVVLVADVNGQRQGYRAELPVSGVWPAVVGVAGVSPALQAALNSNAQNGPGANGSGASDLTPGLTLWAALFGALLGGLILNLMPCVFPVLAIKVVSFTRHADDKRAHLISGLAFTAGVVLSFIALGALMLALRTAGEGLGWGFQLQSPAVVAGLAALFTVMGLNLSGLFEFGQVLPSGLATLRAKNPAADSFLSGVLAVAVASPCTAPFMGASLGFALGLPARQALLIFAAIGLGLALPYLAASLVPGFARALPRPGAWMDTFKKFMAFPMFGTVAWLVWVLGQQSGIDGAGALLALLVCLSFVIWALTLTGRARWVIAIISIATIALLVWAIGQNIVKPMDTGPTTQAIGGSGAAAGWQPWEPGRVDQVLATGQPVFVDFTAAWCVTCQYNKKTTLSNKAVLADLEAKKVVLLRADWTRRDPAITATLQQLGRSGVPVYVIYQAGSAPVVLSEILSVDDVRTALARL